MTDQNIEEGRISYDQFLNACDKFLDLAKENNDPWKADGDAKVIGDRFLTVTYTRRMPTNNNSNSEENGPLIQCRYDVTYSVSYSTPVLYFSISLPCGSVLSLDEIWEMFANRTGGERNNMWDIVSQQDHPVLHIPFFCVHPCHNWKLLSECYKGKFPSCEEYLISWLSIVGNTFGLQLSTKYYVRYPTGNMHEIS